LDGVLFKGREAKEETQEPTKLLGKLGIGVGSSGFLLGELGTQAKKRGALEVILQPGIKGERRT